jgi:Zn-finger protein
LVTRCEICACALYEFKSGNNNSVTEATGGRIYYNCQWAQEDVETLYSLLNNNNNNNNNNNDSVILGQLLLVSEM